MLYRKKSSTLRYQAEQVLLIKDKVMTQYAYNTSPDRPTAEKLRKRLEQSRQPALKMKLEERRQAEAVWRMISQLRTVIAA
ncbi:MAG: hypothetical protein JXA25_10560 [Anaerolineales bacterium]|nr:hypothetical protein [Anaerolineales bacterium]